MKIAVVGSRGFNDYELLIKTLDIFPSIELIVSGGAVGADLFGEEYAIMRKIPTKIFLPDWQKHGRSAGIIRNKDIVDNADMVVAFWDGQSKGTNHSINYADTCDKPVLIVNYIKRLTEYKNWGKLSL